MEFRSQDVSGRSEYCFKEQGNTCTHAPVDTQGFILKTMILESGKMVEWPLYKFEDLHSNPQH